MIVLGVIRIRAAHQRSGDARDDEQEMAWDDSSLTITVNPLDVSSILHKLYLPPHSQHVFSIYRIFNKLCVHKKQHIVRKSSIPIALFIVL